MELVSDRDLPHSSLKRCDYEELCAMKEHWNEQCASFSKSVPSNLGTAANAENDFAWYARMVKMRGNRFPESHPLPPPMKRSKLVRPACGQLLRSRSWTDSSDLYSEQNSSKVTNLKMLIVIEIQNLC